MVAIKVIGWELHTSIGPFLGISFISDYFKARDGDATFN
jgi:hypothetical protein